MKQLKLLLVAIICAGITINADAQVFGSLTGAIKEKAKEKLTQKVDEQADYERVKDAVGNQNTNVSKPQPKPRQNNNSGNSQAQSSSGNSSVVSSQGNTTTGANNLVWNRYDFVPGDEIIFEDGPSPDEENGEFPSRWDLYEGNCEIMTVNGENVIAFPHGGTIVPYMKNPKEDYLPDVFTIEFDAWIVGGTNQRSIYVKLYDRKNQRYTEGELDIDGYFSMEAGDSYQKYPNAGKKSMWRHISIAYTRGKYKAYMDDVRLINIPHFDNVKPTGFTLAVSGYSDDAMDRLQYVKNVRIAKGGVKYYDRVMQDGKIICKGIRFEKGKTDLKPESMGSINKIYKLMKKNPDFKFVVVGHTDSDGDDNTNLNLSQGRADMVKQRLIQMGISQDRLQSKGAGESEPIAGNDTPEGKANNRRVEFVKF